MIAIPPLVVEYFLLGKTRQEAPERYTQDGGVVSDVWLAFAANLDEPRRVLVAPSAGVSAIAVAAALHDQIMKYRQQNVSQKTDPLLNLDRVRAGVSPLENFVAVTLYFDEMIRICLPLTSWWHRKKLSALRTKAALSGRSLDANLEQAILLRLGHAEGPSESALRQMFRENDDVRSDRRILEAAPIAALIGLFMMAREDPKSLDTVPTLATAGAAYDEQFTLWVADHAHDIARAARKELSRQFEAEYGTLRDRLQSQAPTREVERREEPPEMIQRVFLDRRASLADTDAHRTIKCDAASRVFEISCDTITWAILDSGIAAGHPAFYDHAPTPPGMPAPAQKATRVRATLDFTRIELIRNFDLINSSPQSDGRAQDISRIATEIANAPGRAIDPSFLALAREKLAQIAEQLDHGLPPDWNLIEPLIRVPGTLDSHLISDHGTHVAGILGGDWRSEQRDSDGRTETLLRGVCPDINLYDLRVIHEKSRQSTEFALLAALEYVQFVNARAAGNGPLIHGVNVSLSIPHDVRNYGCGATPICVACDRLSSSGVVVVAAAGNRGWNEQEMGFGSFAFASITDPGNAQDVITVGSTHRNRPHAHGVSYFSSRGPTGDGRLKPDLVAPGEQIRGPVRGDGDDEMDGTSMAAPFVSGAAAMLLARHRELIGNAARVKSILCKSATDLGREKYFQGHGLVDVLRALQSV